MEGDPESGKEKRAGIFIGPEFGTVSRADLVSAAREAGDAGFDLLIACAFSYDAHSAELERLGRIQILKARMNPDLHMAADLKATGAGNLFVVFGEPDIEVASGQWLVTGPGRLVGQNDRIAELSGLRSLAEINELGRSDLPRLKRLAAGRAIWPDQPNEEGGGLDTGQHRGGSGTPRHGRVPAIPGDREGLAGGGRDTRRSGAEVGLSEGRTHGGADGAMRGDRSHVARPDEIAAIEALKPSDFPLDLTTDHWTQVTIRGVDVFKPQTGEVISEGPDGIALWMIDTDYNEESFFVRHAYFLGANDPYKALKTTLKAEIDEEAWQTLYSDTSRPFPKPATRRIAVKVINHLGDEVMKVFSVE
jgi:adenine-specific DNA-methyltransferase